MMSRLHVLLVILWSWSIGLTAQNDWKLKKNDHGIEVYTRDGRDSKVKELRIKLQIKSSLSSLVYFLEDVDRHKEWVYKTKDSRIVENISTGEFYYYGAANFPFPTKDRDFIMYYKRNQNPTTKVVITNSHSAPTKLPVNDKHVRIQHFESTYKLTPLDSGLVDIDYVVKGSPGGSIPSWIVNLAISKGPTQSMKALIKIMQSPEAQKMKAIEVEEL